MRLLSDQRHHKPTLRPAVARWVDQYGAKRPLTARLTPEGALHDRLITVDGATTYVLTQSLNAFATRSPGTIVRVDDETGALKRAAYQALWDTALAQ